MGFIFKKVIWSRSLDHPKNEPDHDQLIFRKNEPDPDQRVIQIIDLIQIV